MTPFGLFLPPRMRFGRGESLAAVPEMLGFGQRFVLVHGASPSRAAPLLEALRGAGAEVLTEACPREPDLAMLTGALDHARPFDAQAVVAIGGGAVLDMGKALAGLLPAPGADPLDHLEVVGRGLPLAAPPLPGIAVPTTAGTGSEATRNAVIAVPEHRRKVSLRDPGMIPRLAVIDPALTDGTPRAQTMASGLDAVTQVIEPYLSAKATPFTDALCRAAIPRGLSALAQLARAEDASARDALALVAFDSGVALANAGLGVVHGIAGVLGGETGAAHGAICGQLLAPGLRALRGAAAPGSVLAARLAEVDGWCQGALGTGIDGLGDWALANGLPAPDRRLDPATARGVAEASAASSSMKASPVAFGADALVTMLEQAGWA